MRQLVDDRFPSWLNYLNSFCNRRQQMVTCHDTLGQYVEDWLQSQHPPPFRPPPPRPPAVTWYRRKAGQTLSGGLQPDCAGRLLNDVLIAHTLPVRS